MHLLFVSLVQVVRHIHPTELPPTRVIITGSKEFPFAIVAKK